MRRNSTRVIRGDDPAHLGQSVYTPSFLRVYDRLILGLFTRYIWRSPTPRMVALYNRHLGRRHLDIGPGTGYFLEHANRPADFDLTLADPNVYVLEYAARRLAAVRPRTVEANVLEPLPVDGPYDSVALNGVLHCLPGPMVAKAAAISHSAAVLEAEGVLFGATIISDVEYHNAMSRAVMRSNNRRGIFGNADDTVQALREILEASFDQVDVKVVGTMAEFSARRPR